MIALAEATMTSKRASRRQCKHALAQRISIAVAAGTLRAKARVASTMT